MTAKDKIHDAVRNALVKDGWIITHDPLTIRYKGARVFVDLGAEQIIGAERKDEKIAVKIKSFVGPSVMQDLEGAVGQYVIYLSFLEQVEPERKLYLAISHPLSISAFQNEAVQMLVRRNHIALVVVDVVSEEVVQWMPI